MSDSANTLLYWITNARSNIADNDEGEAYCYDCARRWATWIIAGN